MRKTKRLTKAQISSLRQHFEQNEFDPPVDIIHCYYVLVPDIDSNALNFTRLCKVDFVKKDKQISMSLAPDKEYDCESIEKQVKELFGKA